MAGAEAEREGECSPVENFETVKSEAVENEESRTARDNDTGAGSVDGLDVLADSESRVSGVDDHSIHRTDNGDVSVAELPQAEKSPVIERGAQGVSTQAERGGTPATRPTLSLVKRPPSPVISPVERGGTASREAVKPLFTTSHLPVELEWKVEWKTTSKNRRPLVRRLYRKVGARSVPVTRAEVERNEVEFDGPLNVTLMNLTPEVAEQWERKGKDAIKRIVQRLIDQHLRRRA